MASGDRTGRTARASRQGAGCESAGLSRRSANADGRFSPMWIHHYASTYRAVYHYAAPLSNYVFVMFGHIPG